MKILVIGGASGLGGSITKTLASESENIVFFTYSSSSVEATKIKRKFKNTLPIKCDYENTSDVDLLVQRIEDLDIDVLINNAFVGNAIETYFHKIPHEKFLEDFDKNIIPTIRITQSAINLFRRKKNGKIITILTSFLTNKPPIGSSSYVATKAYLNSLVKSWANENIKFNITSNSVSPSFMQTRLTSDLDERILEQLISNHPLKKLLTVEEVSEIVLFLSKASSQINGLDVLINCGIDLK